MKEITIPEDEIRTYLEAKKSTKVFFKSGDGVFTCEIIEKLRELKQINPVEFRKCFESEQSGEKTFFFERKCSSCESIEIYLESKDHFMRYLYENKKNRRYVSWICTHCQERKKQETTRSQEEYKQMVVRNTEEYIENFLSLRYEWKNGLKNHKKMRYLKFALVNWDVIARHIKSMNYRDFLKTLYWTAISERKKIDAKYSCSLCSSSERLEVHHPNYDLRGYELQNKDSLIVLCHSCHERFHFDSYESENENQDEGTHD